MNENIQSASGPRIPNIDPEIYGWLNQIDAVVAKAPLTRTEAIQTNQCFQGILAKLEMMQSVLNRVEVAAPLSEQAPVQNTEGAKMVEEAIDANCKRGLPCS